MIPTALFAYLRAYDGMVNFKLVLFRLGVEVEVDVHVRLRLGVDEMG